MEFMAKFSKLSGMENLLLPNESVLFCSKVIAIEALLLEKNQIKVGRHGHLTYIVQFYIVIVPPSPETPIILTELLECDLEKHL